VRKGVVGERWEQSHSEWLQDKNELCEPVQASSRANELELIRAVSPHTPAYLW
jgi:hypothetical protein